jgi:hypothetical protein
MHYCVGSKRGLVTAAGTLVAPIAVEGIAVLASAHRTNKTVRPLHGIKVLGTSFLVGESFNELAKT